MVTSPSTANVIAAGLWGGRVRCQIDDYTFASAATGTIVNIAYAPKGARYCGVCINHAALGGTATLKVGDSSDNDRLMTAVDCGSTAGQKWGLATVIGYEYSSATTIIVTTGASVATGKISTLFLYSTD
jgi:hypothetical protein